MGNEVRIVLISYHGLADYCIGLANALAESHPVTLVIPKRPETDLRFWYRQAKISIEEVGGLIKQGVNHAIGCLDLLYGKSIDWIVESIVEKYAFVGEVGA